MGGSTRQSSPMPGSGKGLITSVANAQPKYGDPQTGGLQAQIQPAMNPQPDLMPQLAVLPQPNDAQNTIMGGSASDGYGQRKGMAYPNTINQWDNPQQSIQKQMPYGKGSSTASSKLPSPLTNNYSMGGKGKGA